MDTQSSEVTDDVHTKLLFPFFFREKYRGKMGGVRILPAAARGRVFIYNNVSEHSEFPLII